MLKVKTHSIYNGGILCHTGPERNPACVLVNLEVGWAGVDTNDPVLDNTKGLKNRRNQNYSIS